MKGVILAGGRGRRLEPLTLVTNKHLLPVYDRPMIFFSLELLAKAGISEVVIVTSHAHIRSYAGLLGRGHQFGLERLEFAAQTTPGGIADALVHAKDFAAGERICVCLGDNLFGRGIRGAAERFRAQPSGARLILKEMDDPREMGVVRFNNDGSIGEIVEKPTDPPSQHVVTGLYFYDKDVFNMCEQIEPSPRGELEITDLNNAYLRRGDLAHEATEGWWCDAGTIERLHEASTLVAQHGANRSVGN